MQTKCKLWQFLAFCYYLIAVSGLQAQLLPPTDIQGYQESNQFISQADIINVIRWDSPNQGITPTAYQIYRNADLTQLAALIPANQKLQFKDHHRKKDHFYAYYIVSVDSDGHHSAAVGILFKGAKTRLIDSSPLVAIEVSPVESLLPIDFKQQFVAIGIYENGKTKDLTKRVKWQSSNSSVASISQDGIAKASEIGTTQIAASYRGFSNSVNLTVTNAQLVSIEIQPTNQTLPIGYVEQYYALGVFSDSSTLDLTHAVQWTSTDPSVASISNEKKSKGLVKGLHQGITTIRAKMHGVSSTSQLIVNDAILTSLEVNPMNPVLGIGYDVQFTATGIFSDFTTRNLTEQVKWSSSHPDIASISNNKDKKGHARGQSIGSTQIQATLNGISNTTTLTVDAASLISIEITPIDPVLPVGLTKQFTATGLFSDGTFRNITNDVLWSSSHANVAVVSNIPGSKGIVKRLNSGSTTIIATLKDISTGTNVTGTSHLTLTPVKLIFIYINPLNAQLAAGFSEPFTATGIYNDGTEEDITQQVTWSSVNPSIATVSNIPGSKGLVKAVTLGNALITVSVNPQIGTPAIIGGYLTVTPAILDSIVIKAASLTLDVGSSAQFLAIGVFTDGSEQNVTPLVTWISSDSTVATASNANETKGVISASSVGNTVISATLPLGRNSIMGTTNIQVVCPAIQITTTTLPCASAGIPYPYQIQTNVSFLRGIEFKIIEGTLPQGIVLDPTGFLMGIPNGQGIPATFTVQATTTCGTFDTATLTIPAECSTP